jgi:hypothetical protein
VAAELSGTASVFVRSLYVAGYERADGGADGTAVYEPKNDWYEGTQPYRIVGASGTVSADADTAAVESASVSWAVTDPAGTYIEYALVRLTSPDPRSYEMTYEFDPGSAELDRPAWVEAAREKT